MEDKSKFTFRNQEVTVEVDSMIEVEEDLVVIEIMVKEVPEEILEIVQEVASTAKKKVIWPDNALNVPIFLFSQKTQRRRF